MLLRIDISLEAITWILLVTSFALILAVGFFYVFSGIKIQLVEEKKLRLILIASILPGSIFYFTISGLVLWSNSVTSIFSIPIDLQSFTLGTGEIGGTWSKFLLISVGFNLTLGIILKQLAFHSLANMKKGFSVSSVEIGKKILQVENLNVYYPIYGGILKRATGFVKAVNGVSFTIKAGETMGLVGESGCGKSTLAKAILGLVDIHEGRILFNNDELHYPIENEFRRRIQIVFQDPDASLNPRMKIVDILGEPLRNLMGMTNKDDIREAAVQLLEKVSLKREYLERFPHEFSGGQKQRITIARALACNPELIILDEPTSALDVSVQAGILNLLKDLQREFGYAYLFITHNLSVVDNIANNVAVMYLGRFVEYGPVKEIFSNPIHPYTQALLSARTEVCYDNTIKRIILEGEVPSPINLPEGCYFHPRCNNPNRTDKCKSIPPKALNYGNNHLVWCYDNSQCCVEVNDDYLISN